MLAQSPDDPVRVLIMTTFDLDLSISSLTPGGLTNTVPAAVPRVTLTPTGPDSLLFSFPATAGRIYTIESSLNLNTWTPEGTHILPGNSRSVPFGSSMTSGACG